MLKNWKLLLPLSAAVLFAGDEPWKDKKVAEWTADDAKAVMTDSPWAKTVTPTMTESPNFGRGGGGGGGGGEWVGELVEAFQGVAGAEGVGGRLMMMATQVVRNASATSRRCS